MVNILVGCTGSVATIKVPLLVDLLQKQIMNSDIQVVTTEHASFFLGDHRYSFQIWSDKDEWSKWKKVGDPVLHIKLRNWADIFVIAPLDANTLGKLAFGLCDNVLTCVARAWDLIKKPILICPAMNTLMWQHPSTENHLNTLKNWGYTVIPPIFKKLACGENGVGAMEDISVITCTVTELIQNI